MNLYLAGYESYRGIFNEIKPKYVLESFYYIKSLDFVSYVDSFLLDSGAFTFMMNAKVTVDWDKYIERYAAFIVKNDIKLFFELDIDSVVGIKEVERLRDKLETLTQRKCIPVWHKSRGKNYWLKIAEDYDYIAIGGIVSGEITKKDFPHFTTLINLAHERGAKVHGLGLTGVAALRKHRFYSVDSTTWNRSRFGEVCYFDGSRIKYIQKKKMGYKLNPEKSLEANRVSLMQWVKFQRYAEKNL